MALRVNGRGQVIRILNYGGGSWRKHGKDVAERKPAHIAALDAISASTKPQYVATVRVRKAAQRS